MPDDDLTLVRYYAALDADAIDRAAAMLHPDVESAIHLPAGVRRGSTREDVVAYLRGRGDVVRRHHPLRGARDGDVEFVYGAVTEDEVRTTGHFLASVRLDDDGLIASYHVSFDVELALVPEPVR